MTGNEANMSIKYAVCVLEAIGNGLTLSNENDREDACAFAIQALEEIQQYRAIGTVEDIQLIFSLCKDLERIVKKYEAIGTIEEFKASKENQCKCEDCAGCTVWKCDCSNIRNQAITEFAEQLKPIIDEKLKGWTNSDDLQRWCERSIDEIAEKMMKNE